MERFEDVFVENRWLPPPLLSGLAIQYELGGYALGAPVLRIDFQLPVGYEDHDQRQSYLDAIAIDSSNHAIISPLITVTVSN
jgi:hypothetical protein